MPPWSKTCNGSTRTWLSEAVTPAISPEGSGKMNKLSLATVLYQFWDVWNLILVRICGHILKTQWPPVVFASYRVRSPYPLEVPG